jgi:carboxyl-terminal processing protease
MDTMLKLHYFYNDFNKELSLRTIEKIFESLDPEKLFFMQADLKSFQHVEKTMWKRLSQNNCSFLFDIHYLFLDRLDERINFAKNMLLKNIDFSILEHFSTLKLDWPQNTEEANIRMRKKVKFQLLTEQKEKEPIFKTQEKILKNYLKNQKKQHQKQSDTLYSLLLNSFAVSLDPHSAHLLPAEHDSFVIHMSNKLEGIGAQLQEEDGYIVIKKIISGGVAQKDGRLQKNDKIIAVDNGNGLGFQNLIDSEVQSAVQLIRGKKGTPITLMVLRENEKIEISLTRDHIEMKEDDVKSALYEIKNLKIGVIKISNFYTDLKCKSKIFTPCKGMSYDVAKHLKTLKEKNIHGLIVDLRNNGGGDFPESLKLTGLFLHEGIAVQTVDKNQNIKKQQIEKSKNRYTGPLLILINKYSASASEIFSGAIQDYGRGIIVGDRSTYGKATVQIIQEIPGTHGRMIDGALKITQSKFYRPRGTSNQKIGIQSDIFIPSILDSYEIGERELDFALKTDFIPEAHGFKPIQDLSHIIEKLKILSSKRIKENKNYQELINKIYDIKKEKNKVQTLNKKSAITYLKQEKEKKDRNEENQNLIKGKDLQFKEALNIAYDFIKISEN